MWNIIFKMAIAGKSPGETPIANDIMMSKVHTTNPLVSGEIVDNWKWFLVIIGCTTLQLLNICHSKRFAERLRVDQP